MKNVKASPFCTKNSYPPTSKIIWLVPHSIAESFSDPLILVRLACFGWGGMGGPDMKSSRPNSFFIWAFHFH